MLKVLNAFSANMLRLSETDMCKVEFHPIDESKARLLASGGVDSAVGHAATADLFSQRLGVAVPMNRVTVQLSSGDVALLGQISGARLPEGRILTSEEMASMPIQWVYIYVK